MISGVASRYCGSSRWAALKWSDPTCAAPASPSRKASMRTYSPGSSTVRDQLNQRQPGSALVDVVNASEIVGHASTNSDLGRNFAVMTINAAPSSDLQLLIHVRQVARLVPV